MALPKTKSQRIKRERGRLNKIFSQIDEDKKKVVDGILQRTAYIRVQLEDYEADLDKDGYVEMFSQSPNTDPYERMRPVAQLYNSTIKNYQVLIKQLTDLLPKTDAKADDDPLDEWLSGKKKHA